MTTALLTTLLLLTPLGSAPSQLETTIRLELRAPARGQLVVAPLELRRDLRMPRAPRHDGLRLDLRAHRKLTLYLSAELDPTALPRLDAVDGEGHFVVGAELQLGRGWTLVLESFQSSAAVLGRSDNAQDVVADASWDGVQAAVGLRWQVRPQVSFEASPVFYLLSDSGRADSVGVRGGLTLRF